MLKGIGQKGIAVGVGTMLLVAAGCTVDVYSPPPRGEVVVDAPPPQGDVVVTDEPPVVAEEVPPGPPPEEGVVWIQGDIVFEGGHWVRRPGHYGRPPAGRRHWVAATYRRGEHGYVRVEGHWE